MDKGIQSELEARLRAIYDDDDFVLGTIACLGTTESGGEMLAFFHAADAFGDTVTHDDVIALSVVLGERNRTKRDAD